MSSHVELNPDDSTLGLSLGMKAMRLALTQKTHRIGTVRIPTQGDTDVIIGDGAQDGANRIDQDGNQLPLVDTSGIDKAAQDAQQKADAAAAKADQVRSDLQAEVDKVSAKADDLGKTGDQLAGQITDIKGTVNGQRTQLTEFGRKLEGEITRADTTVKSVTELKQTVTSLSSTVSQTTKTASAALSKAATVEQTANGLKATISKDYQTARQADGKYSTKTELSATADGIRADLTETAKTANGAMDKATSLESTADGLSARISETAKTLDSTITTVNQVKSTADSNTKTVSQVADTADGLSKRTSSLEQNLNGFKSEVSQTYTPRTDFDGLTIGGTNLLINSDFSQGLANWVPELQTNGVGTVTADKLSGFDFANTMCTINVTEPTTGLCRIYQLRNPNPMRTDMVDTVSFWAKASADTSLLVGRMDDQHWTRIGTKWKRYTLTVQKWNGSNAFCVAVGANFTGTVKVAKLMWEHSSKPSAWSPAPEDMQRAGDYSTKSYVDQTSKSVALGVVQNYKGADGSGLATKSDITVAKDSITSTVASTYATKSGVTEEISSKITQNNNSLDVKFATKTETRTAQDTANTAKSDASSAQSRVGALESCISLTSDGVQVGKRSNGEFTGPSTLVGTDGIFHVKNRDSNGITDDVVKLGQDVLVVKSKLTQNGGGYIDRLTVGPYGDDHFAIMLSPALAAGASNSSEPIQMWQTGWQNVTTGNGCEVYGYVQYGYRGGCLRFRGRVKTTIDGDNSLFANPGVLNLWVSSMNRNFLLPAYRNNTLGWTNAYIPANSRQVRINGVWDWVSLDQLSIAQ